ncbi:MAG: hypothetical protein KKG69_17980 [Alphaproteobacteria bacterium]|uniref:Uncharacterized protein n=1 Tax=viral metagenome TaxID=1070528 RepID=A0A6H1ZCD9_9ZZZZ|nr:hypothetical protein [Alphaproteobacteria bacterium]
MAVKKQLALTKPIHTVRSWSARKSIPAEYWHGFSVKGLATLEELAEAAALRLAANDDTRSSEAA